MDARRTTKMMPVLIGKDFEHVMGRVTILQEPRNVTITVEVKGKDSRRLADFVAADEVIGLSFQGLPVRHHTKEIQVDE